MKRINKSGIKINKSHLFISIAFIICFEPKLAVKIPLLNYSYILGSVVIFTVMARKYFQQKNISKSFILLVSFRVSFLIQTIINDGDIMMWGYMSIVLMTLCMMFDYYLKNCREAFLNGLINILMYMLLINLLISYIYPNGVMDGIFFIGIRTRISDVIFPLLGFSLINDELNEHRCSFKTIVCFIICTLNIVRFSVTTALMGIVFFVIGYICFCKSTKVHKIITLRAVVYIGVAVSLLFTFCELYVYFGDFIVKVLHKEATLSSRTLIWREAIKYILQSPIIGHGLAQDGNFVYWGYIGGTKSLWQAHNNWLQLLYDGGIISMILFVRFININSRKMLQHKNEKVTSILILTIAIFLIMMISEIYIYTPYFYLVIFAVANISYLIPERKITKHVKG